MPDVDSGPTNGHSSTALWEQLCQTDNRVWLMYAYAQEQLARHLTRERQLELGLQAQACGRQQALQLQQQFPSAAAQPDLLAEQSGLTVRLVAAAEPIVPPEPRQAGSGIPGRKATEPDYCGPVILARFQPPRSIELIADPLEAYSRSYVPPLPAPELIRQLLIAHEIFHFVEQQQASSIFTQQKQLRLWSLGRLHQDCRLPVLGEIAAMTFARTLCGCDFNPFALDVLLTVRYNSTVSDRLLMQLRQAYEQIKPSIAVEAQSWLETP
ncbi:hypothetical protein HCH52_09650 [Oscillospiraceae bacterium HV4-5-C5C]|nr:hypothetical protein [Oscillospiraceae bacterium HV4-5-C5C]